MDYGENKRLFEKRSIYRKDIDFSKEDELNNALRALEEYEKTHGKPGCIVSWVGSRGGPYDSIEKYGYEILPKDVVDNYLESTDPKELVKWDPHISNVMYKEDIDKQLEFNKSRPEGESFLDNFEEEMESMRKIMNSC